MNRRDLLAALGTAAVAGAGGCLGTLDAGQATPDTSTDPRTATEAATTCTDPPWNDPVQVDGTAETSVEGNRTGFRYDLEVNAHHEEGESRLALRIAEDVDADCAPVVFQRVYELDPSDEAVVRDPIGTGGSFVLIADVKGGQRATREVQTHDDGIGSATAYFVSVRGKHVEIQYAQS